MSVSFFGDFDTTETVVIPFNTFDSNDPTASVTITNLVAADIKIHKDGGTTQRSSASGVTVSIDFDTITGNHIVSIDLSDNTDAGFYAVGSTYQVRMEGTTVDAGTINAWIGAYSIGRILRPTVDGRTLSVESDGDLTKVNTLDGHTPQTGDTFAQLPTNFDDLIISTAGNANTDVKINSDKTGYSISGTKTTLDVLNDLSTAQVGTTVAAELATYDGPTNAELVARTIPSADYFDPAADTVANVTLVATTTTNTDMRGTDNASTAAEMAKVPKSDGSVTWNATALASINAEVDTALNTAIPGSPTAASINDYMRRVKFALANRWDITEASGNLEIFDDSDVSFTTVAAAFTTLAGVTLRKKIL